MSQHFEKMICSKPSTKLTESTPKNYISKSGYIYSAIEEKRTIIQSTKESIIFLIPLKKLEIVEDSYMNTEFRSMYVSFGRFNFKIVAVSSLEYEE